MVEEENENGSEIGEAAAEKLLEESEDVVAEVPDMDATTTEQPEWAVLPSTVKLPHKGTQVAFIQIPANWTTNPTRGDRWCACWPLGETEERLAYQRARGDSIRTVSELAKQTIRVVDGAKADWSAIPNKLGSVVEFWSSIGPKGRQMIRNYYVRTHTVAQEEVLDFFSKHFVSMTVT